MKPYSLDAELAEWQALLDSTITYRQTLPDTSPEVKDTDNRIKHYRRMIEAVSEEVEAEKKAVH